MSKIYKINNHLMEYNNNCITCIPIEWNTLWGGNFDGFSVYSKQYYWIDNKYTTYGRNIETDVESSSAPPVAVKSFGWLKIYKSITIPDSRLNDKYVMLEIPFNPYRDTRNKATLQSNMDESVFKVGLIRRFRHESSVDTNSNYNDNFSFDITSTPTSVIVQGHDESGTIYGAGSWSHTLNIPNISYTETFTEVPGASLKIRLLCDLTTKKTYFKIASTFPNTVVLTDYIDTGFTMLYDKTEYYNVPASYIINVYANGYGINMAGSQASQAYLIAGYHVGDGTPITVKSY